MHAHFIKIKVQGCSFFFNLGVGGMRQWLLNI